MGQVMTKTRRNIQTLVIAVLAVMLVGAFPGTASADNPWVGPWVSVMKDGETLGEAVCNVTWKLNNKAYADTVSCTVWDDENDKLAIGLTVSYLSGNKWVSLGSCWNTTGEDTKKSCSFNISKAPQNYTLRMVMNVRQGNKQLSSPTATIEAKNVPNR